MKVLDMAEVITETEMLSMMIANSDIAEEFQSSRQAMHKDQEVMRLIKEFNDKKEQYEEVQRFGKYHPDYLRIRREVFSFKRELEQHPVISRYKEAEKALEELLYEISLILAEQISSSIKIPGTNPYFNGNGCGAGGCSSGGRCGCR